jgi:hypothetical protein
MFRDHLNHRINVCISKVSVLKCEISSHGEQHLLGLVMAGVLFYAVDDDVDVPLVIIRPPCEVRFHILCILLVDP